MIQGSSEWLALRKTKITATDANSIMGVNPWKTKEKLLLEKISDDEQIQTPAMKRGLDLEPFARDLFSIKTGISVHPEVIIKDWAMASLDGISDCGKYIVEIKCPGKKDHECALNGNVPEHYFPQLQHQMYVCNLDSLFYYSFDGFDGIIVDVHRDQEYIDKMIEKELDFFYLLQSRKSETFLNK